MAEQALDLRAIASTLRRRRLVLVGAAIAGALAGVGLVVVGSLDYTSTSQVLLPPRQAGDDTADREVETEVRVAGSDLVLGVVAEERTPPVPARQLATRVQVSASTPDVIEFRVSAPTAKEAREVAQALAEQEVLYVQDAASSLGTAQRAALEDREAALTESLATVGEEIRVTRERIESGDPGTVAGQADATALAQLTAEQASLVLQLDNVKSRMSGSVTGSAATIIQPATAARRPGPVRAYAAAGALGAASGTMLAAIALVARSRRDRRLRYRDELADAVGSPVVASVSSRIPRNVAGWVSLLSTYRPDEVDAWAIRQALRELHLRARKEPRGNNRGVKNAQQQQRLPHPPSVTVISLADDPRGLAMGPQLASYAADAGVPTRLVIGARHESAAALWAACASVDPGRELRPQLTVRETDKEWERPDSLTVILVVVDRRDPVLSDLHASSTCVLAIASGAASAEDLARVAVRADDAGRRIDALVVADPDDLDRTTGRLLHRERAQQVALPGRLTGLTGTPGANVSPLPRRKP
jgi:hypothetical protein